MNRHERRAMLANSGAAKLPPLPEEAQDAIGAVAEAVIGRTLEEDSEAVKLVQEALNKQFRTYMASDRFKEHVNRAIAEACEPILAEVIGENLEALEKRVRLDVVTRFQEATAPMLRERLEKAIKDVKEKL